MKMRGLPSRVRGRWPSPAREVIVAVAAPLAVLAVLAGLVARVPASPAVPAVPAAVPGEGGTAPYRDRTLPIARRVADLVARMTLDEKIAQLYPPHDADRAALTPAELLRRHPDGISALGRIGLHRGPRETALFTNELQRLLRDKTRLGIPALCIDEALHGLMNQGSTSFPQAIALAATWDPALLREVFTAAAREMRARGSNWALTPVLDLARDPRWGRTEETYGEDPYLVSRLGVAAIEGLQGMAVAGNGANNNVNINADARVDRAHVLATAKHFAAHGQPEAGTNGGPANYSERILREQFLAPFQAAVTEAGVASVMASYNEIDGIPSHINHWLLGDLLRGEWRFGGFVTSDGGGIDELVTLHHVAHDRADAARQALAAGVDFELGDAFSTLAAGVRAGRVPVAAIDGAVGRVLAAKFRLGLFDDPTVDPEAAAALTNGPAHQALALRAAREAIVLLQNRQGLLPIDRAKIRSITVLGPDAADVHLGGYSVDPGRGVSILDGIRRKVGAGVTVAYAEGCGITADRHTWQGWWQDRVDPADRSGEAASIAEAARLARAADVAVVVIGENEATSREGWAANHLGDRDNLDLLGGQMALVKAVAATGTPMIVFLINGRPLAIPEVVATAPAILEGFYLGQETGTAVADVLFGDVNPGGKLPITVPRSVGQLPVYYYQKPSGRRGYLWADKEPLFPFGHGLSYTRFTYARLAVTPARIAPDGHATVSVEIANTGSRAGDEVAQLYLHDRESSVTRPIKELKGFQRVTLAPGEKRTVRFEIGPAALSFLDTKKQRVVEPGLFDVMVGGDSDRTTSVTLEVVTP